MYSSYININFGNAIVIEILQDFKGCFYIYLLNETQGDQSIIKLQNLCHTHTHTLQRRRICGSFLWPWSSCQILIDIFAQIPRKFPEDRNLRYLVNYYPRQGLGVMLPSSSLPLSTLLVDQHHCVLSILETSVPWLLVYITYLMHFLWFSKFIVMTKKCETIFLCCFVCNLACDS